MNFDYIIVGAGIAGLYTAYRLPKHMKILILEQSDRIGGRLLQDTMGDTNIPLGGGIIRYPKDKNLIQLIDSLGLELNIYPWKQSPNFQPTMDFDKVIEIMYKSYQPYKLLPFYNFLEIFFKRNYKKIQEFLFLWGFTDMLFSPTETVFKYYGIDDIIFNNPNRFSATIKNGHWDALLNKLFEKIKDRITIKFGETVMDADINTVFTKNHKTLESRIFRANKMVIQTGGPRPVSYGWPFMRVYIRLKKPIELKARSLVTNTRLQRVIQMSPTVIMISYSDGDNALYWKDIETNVEKKKEMLYLFSGGEMSLDDIAEWKYKFWDQGIFYFKNVDENIPFNYVGEWVSKYNQGWVEGAIESVNEFFSKNLQ